MKSKEFKFKASDGTELHVYEWLPEDLSKIKGLIQIAHGLAEHSARYGDFAEFLTSNGCVVYSHDFRGHGKTAGNIANVGFIAGKNGWDILGSDFIELSHFIKEKYQGKSYYALGHSMGSYLIRKLIMNRQLDPKAVIISGTSQHPGILGQFGVVMTQIMMLFYPSKSQTPLMDQLSFGAFNKPFQPNRTKFDWLSRDNTQVDKYINDPYCGGVFSIGFFNEMIKGLIFVSRQQNINNTPNDLPVLFISGENDPVGNLGIGVTEVYVKFKRAGVKDLTMMLFPECRHELHNEINNKEVYQYILDWLDK